MGFNYVELLNYKMIYLSERPELFVFCATNDHPLRSLEYMDWGVHFALCTLHFALCTLHFDQPNHAAAPAYCLFSIVLHPPPHPEHRWRPGGAGGGGGGDWILTVGHRRESAFYPRCVRFYSKSAPFLRHPENEYARQKNDKTILF